jgi:hypothetical protein
MVVAAGALMVFAWTTPFWRLTRELDVPQSPQAMRHCWWTDAALNELAVELCDAAWECWTGSATIVTASSDSGVNGCDFKPHIGSSGGGTTGFRAPSPESQCPSALPAQQGITFADVVASGTRVSANEARIKSAINRPTSDIVKERRRFMCDFEIIDPQTWPRVP